MFQKIRVAVDAMGGDNSPKKIIDGVIHNYKNNTNVIYNIFGDKVLIERFLPNNYNKDIFLVTDTKNKILDTDTPLAAAKKGKDTSMWMTIQSLKNNDSDIAISAGNTGALFLISKLNLNMIDNIDKPALSALWPSKKGMNVVLDLGANIECSAKNLIDFSDKFKNIEKETKLFLRHKMYNNNEVMKKNSKGKKILKFLFKKISKNPNKFFKISRTTESKYRASANYISGMTDRFAINLYNKIK